MYDIAAMLLGVLALSRVVTIESGSVADRRVVVGVEDGMLVI
jgi:hypothetical protein